MKKEYINQRIRSIDALVDMHKLQIDSSKNIIEELKKEKEELLIEKKRIANNSVVHVYGMTLRGFSPGAQPMEGLIMQLDSDLPQYHDMLVYDRKLRRIERDDYELEHIVTINPGTFLGGIKSKKELRDNKEVSKKLRQAILIIKEENNG